VASGLIAEVIDFIRNFQDLHGILLVGRCQGNADGLPLRSSGGDLGILAGLDWQMVLVSEVMLGCWQGLSNMGLTPAA